MLVTQSCPTLGDLMDCNLPGSPVHGLLQARILEQVAIPFSRGSSGPKDQTQVFCMSASLVTQMVKKSYHTIQQFHFWVFIWRKQKTVIQKDKCTPVFIVALFTIAKKQPMCPSIDEWKKDVVYMHQGILLSHKKWNFAICYNMDGSRGYYVRWTKSDREKQILYDLTYVSTLKKKN